MLTVKTDDATDLMVLKVEGRLNHQDYARLDTLLDEELADRGTVALAIDMTGFQGWESAKALGDDARVGIDHAGQIRRMAIVGDAKWEEWMAWIAQPFTSGEVKYFDVDDWAKAKDWAESVPPTKH